MFKLLKEEQRPRRKGKLFEFFSYLPYYNGYVRPFGDLLGVEEVVMSPGGELVSENSETDILFLGREGSLDYRQGASAISSLRKNEGFISYAGSGDVVIRNRGKHAMSRFISLGLRPGEEQVGSGAKNSFSFNIKGNRTVLLTLASGRGEDGALQLSLDAEVSLARIGREEKLIFETQPSRRILLVVLEGSLDAAKNRLNENDSLMVIGEPLLSLYSHAQTRVLIIDLPEYVSPSEERQAAIDSLEDRAPETKTAKLD